MVLILLAFLFRRLWRKQYVHGWTARFIASPEFLHTPEWWRIRYDVLRKTRSPAA